MVLIEFFISLEIVSVQATVDGIIVECLPKLSEASFFWMIGQTGKEQPTSQVYKVDLPESTARWLEAKLSFTISIIKRFDEDDDDIAFSAQTSI